MKIVGVIGAIIGFFIAILLLSFIICAMLISGDLEYERERKNHK